MIIFEHKVTEKGIESEYHDVESVKKNPSAFSEGEYFYYGDLIDDQEYLRELDYRERVRGLN